VKPEKPPGARELTAIQSLRPVVAPRPLACLGEHGKRLIPQSEIQRLRGNDQQEEKQDSSSRVPGTSPIEATRSPAWMTVDELLARDFFTLAVMWQMWEGQMAQARGDWPEAIRLLMPLMTLQMIRHMIPVASGMASGSRSQIERLPRYDRVHFCVLSFIQSSGPVLW